MSADQVGGREIQPTVVNDFLAAWQTATAPPDLSKFVPETAEIRRSALLDLISVDLRNRWLRAGSRKRLAAYCDEFPELRPETLPASLIYEEFVVRRHSGERVDARDYLLEYPAQAELLRDLLNTDDGPSTVAAADMDDEPTGYLDEPTGFLDEPTAFADEPTAFADEPTGYADEPTAFSDEATGFADETDYDSTRATASSHDSNGFRETSLAIPDKPTDLDDIAVGDSIDDFDLLTTLGAGAFARVFLARQRSMQRLVAVKISADHGTEPQTLAQLDHDYIVRVFDQRLIDAQSLKLLYMQFLPGGTLLSVLKLVRETPQAERSGQLLLDAVDSAMEEKGEIRPTDSSVRAEIARLTWPETVAWLGRRLAEALAYADSRGVLHRDVKPANVLLTSEGVPKLADFNISFSRNVGGATAVAYFGGSLSYMSPEQLEACHPGRETTAGELDTRSDIYSLGIVLWELLTGRKPFDDQGAKGGDATTLDAMIDRRTNGLAPNAYDFLPPDCPAALRRVLTTCLQPDREDRWASGNELAKQLDLCMDQRARDLVDPPPHSWRLRLRRVSFLIAAMAMGIPNLLASIYNIHHNQTLIISKLDTDAQHQFTVTTAVINVIFFPLGALLITYLCRYLLIVPHGLRVGKTYDAATLARARRDSTRAGDILCIVAFGLWVIAGIAFPITLQAVSGNIAADVYVHFIASLAVCGAIAVAYPFFLMNFFVIRCLYPIFLTYGGTSPEDARLLRGLDRRSNLYLAVAASIPLLGVAGVTFLQPGDIPKVIFAVRVLCVGGIIAFVFAYWLFRQIEADLRALERVVSGGAGVTVNE
jgi:eukaryotic-like serine/threonine-protein kinase